MTQPVNDNVVTFTCGRCGLKVPGDRRVPGMRVWHIPSSMGPVLCDMGWLVLCKDDRACLARQSETRGLLDAEPQG